MSAIGGPPGERLLRFVATTPLGEVPKPALERARLAVLDWWGVTLAGAEEPVARRLRQALAETAGPATVLGAGQRASPATAALLNGTAGHALDYDDVAIAMPGHPTAPLLPALLALAEARDLGGRALVEAYVVGVEAVVRIARALFPGHYRAGWHATATAGRLGAAAAAGRLLGLDAEGLDRALGLALTQVAGVQEAFGTMAKPFQVGRAAADAVLAALAAEAGVTAPRGILDAGGWARRLGPDWVPERLATDLGTRWAVEDILFKRYPCCFATHAAVTGLLRLRPRLGPRPVARVELEVCPTALQVADQRAPRTGLAGKFSLTYCAAVALCRGRLAEGDFTDEAVGEAPVQALAARVVLHADPQLDETRARVRVELADGGTEALAVDLRQDEDLGELQAAVEAKFRRLAAPRLGAGAAERLLGALGRVEEARSVRALLRPA